MARRVFSAKRKNQSNMLLLLSHPPFETEVAKIRESLGMNRATLEEFESAKTMERRLTEIQQRNIHRAIKHLMDEYNVPENYASHIRSHILYGTKTAPLNNFEVKPFFPDINPAWPNHITVEIYAKLTKPEWTDLKREVDALGKNLPVLSSLSSVEKRITAEKTARSAQSYNKDPNREYRVTYGEAISCENPKTIREDLRELKDLRTKRFGRKKQGPFTP